MRKGSLAVLVCLVTFALSAPGQAAAQGVWLGGGATFPTGDYGEYANGGFLLVGGISFDLGSLGVSAIGEGFWGQNGHDYGDDKTNPMGAMAGLLYDLSGEGEPGFYFFGQAGFMVHKYSSDIEEDSSETGLGFGGGAGYGFPFGNLNGWVEGRYMQGMFDDGDTAFFGLMAGLSKTLGGGG